MINFIEYRDPLFGVLLFFALVFLISALSYFWTLYAARHREQKLRRFAKKFEYAGLDEESAWLLSGAENPTDKLLFLAHAHKKSGDHEKAIRIYLTILEFIKNPAQKQEVLELLGETYFHAGFLQRSKEIYLEVLRHYPRNESVLRHLLYVYESMGDFGRANEVLEPLLELDVDVKEVQGYLRAKKIIQVGAFREKEIEELLECWRQTPGTYRLVLGYLANHHSHLFWQNLHQVPDIWQVLDILWQMPSDKLDFDIIRAFPGLREIFTARGEGSLAEGSGQFELDALIALERCGTQRGDLSFEYLCGSCKQIYPISFERCPGCRELLKTQVVPVLSQRYHEENHSLL